MPNEIYYFRDSEIPEEIAEISPAVFGSLRAGLVNETQVEIEYEHFENHLHRKILPEVLFRSSENWYVAAYCFLREEPRIFRLDRIISAAATNIKESSYGVAEDIRKNGIPWNRPPKASVHAPTTESNSSGLWIKLNVVPGKNGPEIRIESSNKGQPVPKTVRDFSFDLVHDAERGCFDRIKEDLAAGADINFLSGSGNTPFNAAASHGDLAMMKYLVEHGADPQKRTLDGATALMSAVRSGKIDAVHYLVEELKFEVNAFDCRLRTPLFYAVCYKHFEIMEYLLVRGADINCRDREKRTLLMEAVDNMRFDNVFPLKFAERLIQEGVDIHAQDEKGRTVLYYAVRKNQPECVRFLLSSGVSAAHFDKTGASPLLSVFQNYDMARRLLEPYPGTPEWFQEQQEIVQLLIENGADIHASDRYGVTPLMLAHKESLTCLLENGAMANSFDRNGKTAAMYHVRQFDELEQLKAYGADLCARDFEGNDILTFIPLEYESICDFVLRFKVAVTNRNNLGDTLLHRAARAEHKDWALIKFLIRHGADPFAKNEEGDVPENHILLEFVYAREKKFNCIAGRIYDQINQNLIMDGNGHGRFFVQEQGAQPPMNPTQEEPQDVE